MNIEFVLFKNLLDDGEDIQIGIRIEDNQVLCLCCYGTFEEEDYEIIEKKTIEFSGKGDFLIYLHSKGYENLFKEEAADYYKAIHGDILTLVKDAIIYDKILSPQTYLEMMTNNYYCLRAENQVDEVENILENLFGQGVYRIFDLDNISEVIGNDLKVVLVECVNIVMEDGNAEQDHIYRWFEVPDDWTKETFLEQLSKI